MENETEATKIGYSRVILGSYWDNGKQHGYYYNGIYQGYIGVILG